MKSCHPRRTDCESVTGAGSEQLADRCRPLFACYQNDSSFEAILPCLSGTSFNHPSGPHFTCLTEFTSVFAEFGGSHSLTVFTYPGQWPEYLPARLSLTGRGCLPGTNCLDCS